MEFSFLEFNIIIRGKHNISSFQFTLKKNNKKTKHDKFRKKQLASFGVFDLLVTNIQGPRFSLPTQMNTIR